MTHPVGGEIYSAAVPAGFYLFFNHLLAVNFELYFVVGNIHGLGITVWFVFFGQLKKAFALYNLKQKISTT